MGFKGIAVCVISILAAALPAGAWPKPAQSVPRDAQAVGPESMEAAQSLSNPKAGDTRSILNGRRLWSKHCFTCHGSIEDAPYQPGPSAAKFTLPNLPPDLKQDSSKKRSDGYLYGVIHFGAPSGLMPPLGHKFSPSEHWDLVNYIRRVQSR
jgi:mono/diheme cytochrome c family protein